MTRWVTAFGRFWHDFLVGDSMVLAVGGPAVLAGCTSSPARWTKFCWSFMLPVAVVATLLVSLLWRTEWSVASSQPRRRTKGAVASRALELMRQFRETPPILPALGL